MAGRGFFGRIFDAVEGFIERVTGVLEEEPPGPVYEEDIYEGEPGPQPYREEYGTPEPYFAEEPPPAFDRPGYYEDVYGPREYGPGELPETSSAQEEYDYLSEEYDITGDDQALIFLWGGWFDEDITPEERRLFREDFYDYMGFTREDFDWDDWRDWYEATHG